MRIAIVSDIHGNLPALEAVVADIRREAPDQIWCGGDIAWGGPWARECIQMVRGGGWTTVRGNTDIWITGDPQTIDDPARRARLQEMADAHALDQDDVDWLLSLPLGHSGAGSILLVHGTPETPFDAPGPDAPAASFEPYEGAAAIVVYGHVHEAFTRRLTGGTIVCNSGSVGMPKDAPTASYLLLDQSAADWTLRHRRVAFDRAAAEAQGRQTGGALGRFFLEQLEVA